MSKTVETSLNSGFCNKCLQQPASMMQCSNDHCQFKSMKVKCKSCFIHVKKEDLIDGACPVCGLKDTLESVCPGDHCDCNHNIVDGVKFCDLCGEPVCPECGSHNVEIVSRITGYMSAFGGWNSGKRTEFMERHRVSDSDMSGY